MADSSQDNNISAPNIPKTTRPLTMESLRTHSPTVADLRNDDKLWYRLDVLIYDLHNFREISKSQEHLDSIIDASYIGLPYFTSSEAQMIKSTVVDTSPPVHPGTKKSKSKSKSKSQSQTQTEPQNASQAKQNPDCKRLDKVIEKTLNEHLEEGSRNGRRVEISGFVRRMIWRRFCRRRRVLV